MVAFKYERDLCASFIEWASTAGFTSYPEVSGWDFVLERKGLLVGVQAKLRASLYGLEQVERSKPVHIRALIFETTPKRSKAEKTEWLKTFQGLAVKRRVLLCRYTSDWSILNKQNNPLWLLYYLRQPSKLCWLPPQPSSAIAGDASPKTVSKFQLAALYLEWLCRVKGWITRDDVRKVTERENGKWNISTLLGLFRCTREKCPDNPRQSKWILSGWPPSRRFKTGVSCVPELEEYL